MQELAGSFGDLGTFLPLVVSVCQKSHLDIGAVFVCAGALNIATGLLFRQPIPVQPMKALAAVAITEGMGLGGLVAAGMFMGAILVVLAGSGLIDRVSQWVPRWVVRGIQLGVGAKLALEGGKYIWQLPAIGWDSWLTAILLGTGVMALVSRRQPALLYVFVLGFVLLYLGRPEAYAGVSLSLPAFAFHWPGGSEWFDGLVRGTVPQLPLTLLNSVVAVCALSAEYFPRHPISPRRMAMSVGMMNLLTVPIGVMPMCHGAGGLAGQYHFGARTGGSVVMLGALKIVTGLAFGSAILGLLAAYPKAILGIMLIGAGLALAWVARDARRPAQLLVVLATAASCIVFSTAIGFAVGCAAAGMLAVMRKLPRPAIRSH
ncbi:putative sulfate/molybdate transporter [Fontivita pretiosa]|uniref:putative sulfate/molybdate transporter n=1 Tax=Fontivita pretiosa TaxID=2989684 RepID=UPI003D180DC3